MSVNANIAMAAQGGEVRKLHIIYFVSRMGHIEQPHLIRVHHLARNGVHLRDVKRWLGELRGKDMPEAFAWSYKRRYKTGYVWQDLLDDDLITPTSDNEYVLQAYQFDPIYPYDKPPENDGSVSLGKKHPEAEHEKVKHKQPSDFHKLPDSKTNNPRHVSLANDGEPPFQSAMLTDLYDTFRPRGKLPGEEGKGKEQESNPESSFRYMYKLSDKKNKDDRDKMVSSESSFSSSSSLQAPFSKSNSNEAAQWFRRLINCRAIETNDAVLIKMNMANKTILNKPTKRQRPVTQISRKGNLGGSAKVFGTTLNKWHL